VRGREFWLALELGVQPELGLPKAEFLGGGLRREVASLFAGVAQLVERQPSKLNVVGSSPISRSARASGLANQDLAHLAQLVEHVLGKDEVTSSILVVGSKQESLEALNLS
jgi:hypothetical protein